MFHSGFVLKKKRMDEHKYHSLRTTWAILLNSRPALATI